MSQFDQREQAFETKFAHDQEIEFRIASHTANLFGQWVAAFMGLQAEEAKNYAIKINTLSISKEGITDIIREVDDDLRKIGFSFSRKELQKEIDRCEAQARRDMGL